MTVHVRDGTDGMAELLTDLETDDNLRARFEIELLEH